MLIRSLSTAFSPLVKRTMLNIPAAIILASLTQAPIGGGLDDAVSIYECDFGSESDRNYDGWPDGWSRKAGLGYPKYVKLKSGMDLSRAGRPSYPTMAVSSCG
jgi:hypothetical protein